jgi:hypothetical protein
MKNYCRENPEQCIIDAFFSFTEEKEFVLKTLNILRCTTWQNGNSPESNALHRAHPAAELLFQPGLSKVCGCYWVTSNALFRLRAICFVTTVEGEVPKVVFLWFIQNWTGGTELRNSDIPNIFRSIVLVLSEACISMCGVIRKYSCINLLKTSGNFTYHQV